MFRPIVRSTFLPTVNARVSTVLSSQMGNHCVYRTASNQTRTTTTAVSCSVSQIHQASLTRVFSTSSKPKNLLSAHDLFAPRHIGPNETDVQHMLKALGVSSVQELISKTVPQSIMMGDLKVGEPKGEKQVLEEFKEMMGQNQILRSHIGTGYYPCITPPVILRNILENPGWYTPYTPYSAEIAQGRLEMLLNFQTMVSDLTGLPCANASLLDEATAAAEAVHLCASAFEKTENLKFLVADHVHPQTISVVQTRAAAINIEIVVSPVESFDFSSGNVCGLLIQYPTTDGRIERFQQLAEKAHQHGARVVVATDLLALTKLKPPGEWGADVALGSAQRFGVPLGFGGPHAAFFAVQEEHKRKIPGRIIGVSRDVTGKPALRMAMQTREQHIRRDKATSNICTAQALLANISAAYGIYHGPEGLARIADKAHAAAVTFADGITKLGFTVGSKEFFDTVHVKLTNGSAQEYQTAAEKHNINLRVIDSNHLAVSFDETTTSQHVDDLFKVFAKVAKKRVKLSADDILNKMNPDALKFADDITRTSAYMTHPVFHMYRSETEMLRYLYSLQSRDLSLQTAMIPLGSCTMKLNATSEMIPVTWPEVGQLHPFAPVNQTVGYQKMLEDLGRDLCDVTGFDSISFQPNSGAQGEYAGLLVIQAYHASRGDKHRTICLIPTSAHGTNPASAVMAGMKVVVVSCTADGAIDVNDLKAKVEQHKDNLSCLMLTYPSTYGVFEEGVKDICKLIHDNGGQVYMDGANMNAQVGLTSPGLIGADVCHLNLHKTFCIPHGGGGPGMGPIGVAKHLAPFLPGHPLVKTGGDKHCGTITAAPFSSASILPISYVYIKLMGSSGLKKATEIAILNANYMARRLRDHFHIRYVGQQGFVAHEFILDFRPFKATTGVTEEDVAKRLMDFNFHAPTMSWPVVGTLMVEPTESESLYELDRFCDAMIKIREEIREIEEGKADKTNNVLKRAPHTAEVVLSDSWDRPYSREKAAYSLKYLRDNKFWPTVSRIDNVFGDRNVVCTCPPLEAYTNK